MHVTSDVDCIFDERTDYDLIGADEISVEF